MDIKRKWGNTINNYKFDNLDKIIGSLPQKTQTIKIPYEIDHSNSLITIKKKQIHNFEIEKKRNHQAQMVL